MEKIKNANTLEAPAPGGLSGHMDDNGVIYEYTVRAGQLRERKGIEFGRPDIARDTPVEGGVYWGSYGGEAIVVDGEKYPTGLNKAMERIDAVIHRPDGSVDKAKVMQAVYDTVRDMMHYSKDGVENIFQHSGGKDFTKIALDTYVDAGVGVCRHQALFAAQILEKLKSQGVISGSPSVDRNMVRSGDGKDDKYDGHAWVRYTNSGGEVYIIDPAQGKIGTLESLVAGRDAGDRVWEYARPGDRDALREEKVMRYLSQIANSGGRIEPYQLPQDGRDMGYDAEGKIITHIPGWVKNSSASASQESSGAANVKGASEVGTQARQERQKSPVEKFFEFQTSILSDVKDAIDRSGHIDPCALAYQLGAKIRNFAMSTSVSDEVDRYLIGTAELCATIGGSGNDTRSPYYRNQRKGLSEVWSRIAAIKKG